MKNARIMVTCPKGIAPYLKEEVVSLGLQAEETVSGVMTAGTMQDVMRLNLHLRTGHRVLFHLADISAESPQDLYQELAGFPWEEYIDPQGYVSVSCSVDTPQIHDSRYVNLKCKDAIVDRIRMEYGIRPDSGPEKDRTVVSLYWKGTQCAVYLDTSGVPLSRRGYRKIPLDAPLQETLAAAIVMATRWNGEGDFINPMCGSGTIAIEAALLALRRAPGLLRSNFGFMHLKGYRNDLWESVRRQSLQCSQSAFGGRIIATDNRPEAVAAAKKNAFAAGVEQAIEFSLSDFAGTAVPGSGGVVVLNPAYGERMGELEKLSAVYRDIGDFFKKQCGGYHGYIFTGNAGLAKHVGLKTKRKMMFFNGPIECRLLEYELYEGSRKRK